MNKKEQLWFDICLYIKLIRVQLCSQVLGQLDKNQNYFGRRDLNWENETSLSCIFLIDESCEGAQFTMAIANHELMFLCDIRKKVDESTK